MIRIACSIVSFLLVGACATAKPAEKSVPPNAPQAEVASQDEGVGPPVDTGAEIAEIEQELAMAPPETESLTRGGRGGDGRASVAPLAGKHRECQSACERIGDDSLPTQSGNAMQHQEDCFARCACLQGAREAFVDCINGAGDESAKGSCRSDFTGTQGGCR